MDFSREGFVTAIQFLICGFITPGYQVSGVPAGAGYDQSYAPQQRRGLGTGAAVGLGVGALAAGGLAGYALGGGFSSDSPSEEAPQISSFSEDFGGDDWMD
ncbi:uncharacterized protein LOC123702545 [Colias croceus]|uniref:uncharacterized protein LOC123702545 n=1 Tax=Colias crocea TaxID=72248 RepID=UPI001E27EB46|nr:uncharacterized protein LOC123702545 [Colias croceus]